MGSVKQFILQGFAVFYTTNGNLLDVVAILAKDYYMNSMILVVM
jgi:hypothetical protein